MKNKEIREAAKKAGVFLWRVAERLGVTEFSFSRKLRHELSTEEKAKVLSIIEELRAEQGGE